MQVELTADEIDSLVEALDYLKTKIALTKGTTYAQKTAQLSQADELESKLRRALEPR